MNGYGVDPRTFRTIGKLLKCPYIVVEDYEISEDTLTVDLSNHGATVIDLSIRDDLYLHRQRVGRNRSSARAVGSDSAAPVVHTGDRNTFQTELSFFGELVSNLGLDDAIESITERLTETYERASTEITHSAPAGADPAELYDHARSEKAREIAEEIVDLSWIEERLMTFPDVPDDVQVVYDVYLTFKTARYLPWEKKVLRLSMDSGSVQDLVSSRLHAMVRDEAAEGPREGDQRYLVDACPGYAAWVSPILPDRARAFCDIFLTERDRERLKNPLHPGELDERYHRVDVLRAKPYPIR